VSVLPYQSGGSLETRAQSALDKGRQVHGRDIDLVITFGGLGMYDEYSFRDLLSWMH